MLYFASDMSFCCNATRSGSNSASLEYLRSTSLLLKSHLQCWIASVLAASWMPIDPISETVEDNGILYPLGLITCDLTGIYTISSRTIILIVSQIINMT